MRRDVDGLGYDADVDRIGCACLSDPLAPLSRQRFHVLIGLLLSSQTKDPVTANAISNLKRNFNGLTVESIANCKDLKQIDNCISKVGFHNRVMFFVFCFFVVLLDNNNM